MRVQDLLLEALHAKRENRLEDARRDLRDAAAQLREKNVPSELADVLRDLGELERRLRNADAARGHYEEAVAILSGVDDPLRLAHTMRHLGDVHYEAERTTAAELAYRESIVLYRNAGRTKPLDLANAIRSMAVLKSDFGPAEEARALWQEALELYADANVQPGVAECTARLKVLSLRT